LIKKELLKIQSLSGAGNKSCADCGSTIGVTFVDVKHGCFICIGCAGINIKFGTDYCRVKSIHFDNFSIEELSMFSAINGNVNMNNKYEHRIEKHNYMSGFNKPNNMSDSNAIREFIKNKYVKKLFYCNVPQIPINEPVKITKVANTLKKQEQQKSSDTNNVGQTYKKSINDEILSLYDTANNNRSNNSSNGIDPYFKTSKLANCAYYIDPMTNVHYIFYNMKWCQYDPNMKLIFIDNCWYAI
jgi:hypothetical protein